MSFTSFRARTTGGDAIGGTDTDTYTKDMIEPGIALAVHTGEDWGKVESPNFGAGDDVVDVKWRWAVLEGGSSSDVVTW